MHMNEPSEETIEALLRKQFDGAVRDEGFSERVMQRLPPRRRRVVWPLWTGVLAGIVAGWLALLPSRLLRDGWRDWLGMHWSAATAVTLTVMVVMALLALAWSVAEADDR